MRSVRYWRRYKFKLVLLIVVLFLMVLAQSGWLNDGLKTAELNQPGLYSVVDYSDGDTIVVNMNGRVEIIRFIGVDTPETHDPRKPVQCYGQIAADYTKARISQFGHVRLQADPLDTNRDVYGRLLRYVYLPDGTLLDEELIKNGYGFAYLSFPFEKTNQFAAAQKAAQTAKAGLWTDCQPTLNQYGGYTSNSVR